MEPKKSKKISRIVSLIFTLIGLSFVVVGGVITYSTYVFMANSEATTGQVLFVNSNTSNGSTTYQPTFSYVDFEGQQQQGTTMLSANSYNFDIGKKMEILYDRRNFSNVRLANWFSTWGFGLIFMAAGIVPLLIGQFMRRIGRSSTRSSNAGRAQARNPDDDFNESDEDPHRKANSEPTVRR